MRRFPCDRCGQAVHFAAQQCPTCDGALGYDSETRSIRTLLPTAEPAMFTAWGSSRPLWRCLNTAWGCNWTLPAHTGATWCRSCALTRGRPDDERPAALDAWARAEAAKRRLVHQLDDLGLPVVARSDAIPGGLAFDFVALPGTGGITGHRDGVVTLDLAEVDDRYRDDLRRQLGERFRSVIGHLRHEIGHYYWTTLVQQPGREPAVRRTFGDERVDYGDALAGHYAGATSWDVRRFVSPYAASHPLEDWAETFAHYLHILDATGTAVAHGLLPDPAGAIAGPTATLDFSAVLAAWRSLHVALDAISEAVGSPAVFPVDPLDTVTAKLVVVHELVQLGVAAPVDRST